MGAALPTSAPYTVTSQDKSIGIPFQIGISNSDSSTIFGSTTKIVSTSGVGGKYDLKLGGINIHMQISK